MNTIKEEIMAGKETSIFRSCVIAIVVLFVLVVTSEFVLADLQELEHIRKEIKSRNARWHADETSVSKLTQEEKKLRLGVKEGESLAAFATSSTPALVPVVTAAIPTLDWRNVSGVSYISPVKNQGSCGSCWAFAVTAALESQYMIASNGSPLDLSEQILLSCSGAGSCSGGYPTTASNYIKTTGLPVESAFPYTATNNTCSNAAANWQNSTYKVNGWHTPSSITVDNIKNALYAYGPALATFYVYNDFYSYRSGIYSYTSGSYVGAHAVLVVGYDDTNQAFIVKNSWGSGWGEAGYFMIAYSEVGGTSRFGYSVLVYDGYGSSPTPPPDPPPSPTCSFVLSSTGKTFKPAGGSGSFSLSTGSGCSWQASNTAPWVRILSGSSGSGSGTLSYTVDPNTGSQRTTTINVQGQSYTINQQKAPNRR
jgi:C1A family cysteine protease